MDPFTGLGSTAVACARLGVNFIGADIDETYLDEAVERTTAAAERGRILPVRGEARMKKATSAASAPARRSSAALGGRIPSASRRSFPSARPSRQSDGGASSDQACSSSSQAS